MIRLEHGDCLEVLPRLAAEGVRVDAVVTDPPYHLTSIVKRFGAPNAAPAKDRDGLYKRASRGFMGKTWDGGEVAFRPETWGSIAEVMRPGAHLVACGGTRTYHRLASAIEDAGFEIRDQIGWLFGSGFPKSLDVSKSIDKTAGAERQIVGPRTDGRYAYPQQDIRNGHLIGGINGGHVQMIERPATDAAERWQGWGTGLKPAWEPIVLARKPLIGTVAANVEAHGTGALNIDGCRIEADGGSPAMARRQTARRTGNVPTAERLLGTRSAKEHDAMGRMGRRESPDMYLRDRPGEQFGRWPANVILSYPEDEYLLRGDITHEQKTALYRWMSENA